MEILSQADGRSLVALDEFELARGEAEGRPRVKVCHVDEMLEVIHASRVRRGAAAEPERSVGVAD